jgi:TP901 family phage tail tape measure protein
MPTVQEYAAKFTGDTSDFEAAVGRIDGSFGGIVGSAAKAGVALAAIGGTAVVGGLIAGTKAAGDLQQSVANISTIKPDIDTSAVFSALNDMSTRVPQSASQLGDSLYNVFSSIETTQTGALKLVEQFAQGAVGAQTDAETFGTSVLGVMNAYGLSVDDASHISDVFFNTVNKGVVTGQELASSLGPVTQSAKAAGVGLDELGGFIAGVTKEGGPAAQNINNLNNFLQKITTKEATKALDDLGVATKTATGDFRPTTDVLTDLQGKLGDMTEAARANALQTIFPDAQARIGAQTLLSQLDFVKQAIEDNKTSAGSASSAFETMNATFNSQVQILGNTFQSILTTVGATVLPAITPIITAFAQQLPAAFASFQAAAAGPLQAVQDAFQTIVQVFQGNWAPDAAQIQPFVNAVGIAATFVRDQLLPAVTGLVDFLGGHMEIVAGFGASLLAMAAVAGTAAAIAAVAGAVALLVSPIGLVVVGIGLLTAAWIGNWGDIQGKTQAVVSAVSGFITGLIGFFSDFSGNMVSALNSASAAVVGFLNGVGSGITAGLAAIGATWTSFWDGVGTFLSGVWDGIVGAVGAGWAAIQGAWEAAQAAIVAAVTAVWNQIPADIQADLILIVTHVATQLGAALTTVTTWVSDTVTAFAGWVTDTVAKFTGWGTQTSAAVTETTGNWLTTFTKAFADVIGAVAAWVSDFIAPFVQLGRDALTKAQEIGTNIVQGITEKITEAVRAITTWGGDVVTELGGIVGRASTAAATIGTGIIDGITGAITTAKNKVGSALWDVVRAGLDQAKLAAGISSPSTVAAAEVGAPLADGVIQGFVDRLGSGNSTIGEAVRAIVTTALKYGEDPTIALALAKAESNLNPSAIGDSGHSVGLFQLHDQGQGAGMSVALRQDPWANAEKFLSQHGALFEALNGNYSGPELAARFGVAAEKPKDQSGAVYAQAYREIAAALGPLQDLYAKATAGQQQYTEAVSQIDPKAAELTRIQDELNTAIGQGFPRAAGAGTSELQAFGSGAQILLDTLLSGNSSIDETQSAMIRLASSTGLAIAPAQQMQAGLINQDQALKTVLATVAEVNPAYASTAAGFIMGATTSQDATLNFVQLAASTKGMTDAVIPADQAMRTMAGYMPTVAKLAVEGGLAGDDLTRALLGLTEASGFAKTNLDLQTASSADLNGELARIVDEMSIVDPRFAALNQKIKDAGGITDETRGDFVNLLGTIGTTPGAIDPAIKAHGDLAAGAKSSADATQESWQDILREIRDSVREMASTVKSGVGEIVGALKEISQTKVTVDTKSASKSIDELSNDARDAIGWLKKLEDATGQKVRFSGGPSGKAAGGWVQHAAAGMNPVMTGELGRELAWLPNNTMVTPHWKTAMIEDNLAYGRGGRGGDTIVVHINGDVYGVDNLEDRVIKTLRSYKRRGGEV